METVTRLLTIDEACTALGVTRITLRRLVRAGKVPGVKLGGEWRFPSNIAARVLGEAEQGDDSREGAA